MAGIVPYVIWAAIIITGLSTVAIFLFGIRNITYGKLDYVTMTLLAAPIVLFAILGFALDTWAEAAVVTFLILLTLTSLSLLISSMRGLFGM